jgi:hypothetical protein
VEKFLLNLFRSAITDVWVKNEPSPNEIEISLAHFFPQKPDKGISVDSPGLKIKAELGNFSILATDVDLLKVMFY